MPRARVIRLCCIFVSSRLLLRLSRQLGTSWGTSGTWPQHRRSSGIKGVSRKGGRSGGVVQASYEGTHNFVTVVACSHLKQSKSIK